MSERWDDLWVGARLATMVPRAGDPWGTVDPGCLATRDGAIVWVGAQADLPGAPATLAERVHDLAGAWVTPGLIDCHTHLVWGGSRADELERRLAGESYAEIARSGGGILSTVRATRAASEEELYHAASRRVERLLEEGVTTLEIKSGYGLDRATEAKMLRVARRLGASLPVSVTTTYLALHAVPEEYRGREDEYVTRVCDIDLPELADAGLVDAVDAFCESIAFSIAQVERLFVAARALGLPLKLHAEQLSNLGGAALAAKHQALSADHLEYLDRAGAEAMRAAGTVAVLLPGAFYTLSETHKPPVALLRELAVPLAVATDANPGSSPLLSLLTAGNMACILFGLRPVEAVAGITREAARALGLSDRGTLAADTRADFCVWDVDRPAALVYEVGLHRPSRVVRGGRDRASS